MASQVGVRSTECPAQILQSTGCLFPALIFSEVLKHQPFWCKPLLHSPLHITLCFQWVAENLGGLEENDHHVREMRHGHTGKAQKQEPPHSIYIRRLLLLVLTRGQQSWKIQLPGCSLIYTFCFQTTAASDLQSTGTQHTLQSWLHMSTLFGNFSYSTNNLTQSLS